jgi:hypothetical protein
MINVKLTKVKIDAKHAPRDNVPITIVSTITIITSVKSRALYMMCHRQRGHVIEILQVLDTRSHKGVIVLYKGVNCPG